MRNTDERVSFPEDFHKTRQETPTNRDTRTIGNQARPWADGLRTLVSAPFPSSAPSARLTGPVPTAACGGPAHPRGGPQQERGGPLSGQLLPERPRGDKTAEETHVPPSGLPVPSRKMCVTRPWPPDVHPVSSACPVERQVGPEAAPDPGSIPEVGRGCDLHWGGVSATGATVPLIRVTALQNGVGRALSFLLPLLLDVSLVSLPLSSGTVHGGLCPCPFTHQL